MAFVKTSFYPVLATGLVATEVIFAQFEECMYVMRRYQPCGTWPHTQWTTEIFCCSKMTENRARFTDQDLLPSPLVEIARKQVREDVEDEVRSLQFTSEIVAKIRSVFVNEMELGMRDEPSSLQMENTYIPELPDGTEDGKYLALDLGGTNFRVLLVEFKHGSMADTRVKHYQVAEHLRLGPGTQLFDFLADCIADFVMEEGLQDEILPLGFTFSFPMVQHSLRTGVLVTWTKTFNCPDVVGVDCVALLNQALVRRGCSSVEVHAVLNDTTGTLMMGALLDNKAAIGLILGTGSNACYLERADRVKHWETKRHGEKEVVIDIEWGAFGDNGVIDFIKTEYDRQVDDNSLLVRSFTFEKYISGKYLGEIVRVVLVKLVSRGLLFGGKSSTILDTNAAFTTDLVSKIEEDVNGKATNTEAVLREIGVTFTKEDIRIVQYVCRMASNRSALLVSTLLAAILDRMGKDEATIAIDGSLCEKHPTYRGLMEKYIALFTTKKFRLLQVSDGSGKGAAIAVAIAVKLEKRFGE